MRISSKLKLAALVPAIMTLAVGLAVVYSSKAMEVARSRSRVAQLIMNSANDLPTLGRGYLLYNEDRPRQQFLAEQAELDRLAASVRFPNRQQNRLLLRIRDNSEAMKRTFLRLVSIQARTVRPADTELHREAEERLAGHLVVKSHDVLSDAVRLQNLINNDMSATQTRVSALRFLFTLFTAVALTILLTRLQRRIASSLAALRNGTETVAGGDLTYRIGLKNRDEIGDVSRAFDLMTERLQETTVSRDALGQEVEERKRVEEALREANAELDTRAEELSCMNEELAVSNEEIAATNRELHQQIEQRSHAEAALRESEAHKLEFYRRTILAATQGKLLVTDRDDIMRIAGRRLAGWSLTTPDDLATVRHLALKLAKAEGIHDKKLLAFLSCVGEATSNACNHAGGGEASLYRRDGHLFFLVSDNGPGIPGINLPNVALEEGYTTAGTLGMGYKLIMASCDRVLLATGPEGTTVAMEMAV
jgi:nitrate/nitrite-specific signal transduction histidine kinase